MSVAETASFREVTSTSQQTLVPEGGMDVPYEATQARKDLQLRDSQVEMKGF